MHLEGIVDTGASEARAGSLVCVGVGMTLGSHLGPLARNQIETAEVVFTAMSDGLAEQWLSQMHRDVRSLQPLYREGKSRDRIERGAAQAQ